MNSPTSMAADQVTPRDAATVAVVRDAHGGGLDTLLLRRTHRASFVAGAHVFPGGAIDAADGAMVMLLSNPLPTVRRRAQRLLASVVSNRHRISLRRCVSGRCPWAKVLHWVKVARPSADERHRGTLD